MPPQRALVTGGTGYLGQLVVSRFVAAGVPTVSVDIRKPAAHRDGVVDIVDDLRALDLVALLREHRTTAVVHLAAIVEPPRAMGEPELESIEVGGTRAVVDACVATGIAHLTVLSSGAAYGYTARNDGRLLDEDAPASGSPKFAYSRHKAMVEALVARTRRLHPELGILLLRPGTILGAATDNQITALFRQPVILGLRESDTPFVFVWDEDVAEIIVTGVERAVTGTFNVAGDGAMTLAEIAAVEGRRLVRLPASGIRRALAVGSRLGIARYGPEQVDFLRHRPVLDNARLRRAFPGLPSLTSRETYDLYRRARRS
ncbi:NAD-dependent epimerase/dehydratase family protein [Solwaraspora sp. WMMB335]|uniref:NAD-dependent epimerase/dehydratase family protein n=1 Tax=Solwaraspora sp. WMMB335 TaxID=3404118 RepID=UPI003B935FB0